MKTSRSERARAEQVSAAVDQLIRDPNARPMQIDPADAGMLATARQLAQLPSLLGAVDPILEQQVMRQVRVGGEQTRRLPRSRPGWAAAGLAVILIGVLFLTPLGKTAVASFMAVFNLGRTEVRITPVDTPSSLQATAAAEGSAIRQNLTLEEAQALVPFAIPQPSYLPPGYRLREVNSYTYPDLPPWIPQPFFVELVYDGGQNDKLILQVYPITLGDQASISGLNLQATPIQDVRDVDVGGQPGVLLQLGSDRAEVGLQQVVWEQGDLILALAALHMTEADLLRVAQSIP